MQRLVLMLVVLLVANGCSTSIQPTLQGEQRSTPQDSDAPQLNGAHGERSVFRPRGFKTREDGVFACLERNGAI